MNSDSDKILEARNALSAEFEDQVVNNSPYKAKHILSKEECFGLLEKNSYFKKKILELINLIKDLSKEIKDLRNRYLDFRRKYAGPAP